MTADLVLVTSAERPDLRPQMLALGDSPWPEFLNHDAVTNELWPLLHELAPDYQFALLDAATNDIAAIGNCIPIRWTATLAPSRSTASTPCCETEPRSPGGC